MATNVFDKLVNLGSRAGMNPARTRRAREWFRDLAGISRATPDKMIREYQYKASAPSVGRMYHFRYDPKGKETLPYYDTFPLIFMVGPAAGGFYGINLHYLAPQLRAKLMDALYSATTNKKYDETTQLKISYDILKGASKFAAFKPTFKHYLASHVTSQFIEVQPTHWDIALFLPTERFKKANKGRVHSDSRKMI